jgi:hypothetical protein
VGPDLMPISSVWCQSRTGGAERAENSSMVVIVIRGRDKCLNYTLNNAFLKRHDDIKRPRR